jgi:hypothetical protein
MNRYLAHLVESAGGDKSGRWLESATHGARKKDYWKNLTDDVRVMNTNDIQILAIAFDVTPFQFVADARAWQSASSNVVTGRFGVAPPEEDELDAVARPSDPEPTDEQ